MRNAISSLKQYRWRLGLSSRAVDAAGIRAVVAVLVFAVTGVAVLPFQAENRAELVLPGRPATALAAIFCPRHAPAGSYRVTVLEEPIEAARKLIMTALAPGAAENQPPGAWRVERVDALTAFGDGGIYDRSRLARLYAGKAASVVRAPIEREGHVVASLTLVSPYPDAELQRLLPGTLAILFDAEAARRRSPDCSPNPNPSPSPNR